MKPVSFSAIALALMLLAPRALPARTPLSKSEYIEKYKSLAIEDMEKYGIPASITMAQALLESDNGNSTLAREANNHFGIKCKNNWTGETILHDDDAPGECFRKYGSVEESFRDHSEFLDNSPRYQELFKLNIMDYAGWARGLKAAGYATNPKYAEMLIKIIEENKLYLLDEQKPLPAAPGGKKEGVALLYASGVKIDLDHYSASVRSVGSHTVYINNGSEFIVAGGGESYETLGKLLGISASRLRRYNDQRSGSQPFPGSAVYIRSKAKRSFGDKLLHTVGHDDNLWSISQLYGIRLKELARLNRISSSASISAGQQIRLM